VDGSILSEIARKEPRENHHASEIRSASDRERLAVAAWAEMKREARPQWIAAEIRRRRRRPQSPSFRRGERRFARCRFVGRYFAAPLEWRDARSRQNTGRGAKSSALSSKAMPPCPKGCSRRCGIASIHTWLPWLRRRRPRKRGSRKPSPRSTLRKQGSFGGNEASRYRSEETLVFPYITQGHTCQAESR